MGPRLMFVKAASQADEKCAKTIDACLITETESVGKRKSRGQETTNGGACRAVNSKNEAKKFPTLKKPFCFEGSFSLEAACVGGCQDDPTGGFLVVEKGKSLVRSQLAVAV